MSLAKCFHSCLLALPREGLLLQPLVAGWGHVTGAGQGVVGTMAPVASGPEHLLPVQCEALWGPFSLCRVAPPSS